MRQLGRPWTLLTPLPRWWLLGVQLDQSDGLHLFFCVIKAAQLIKEYLAPYMQAASIQTCHFFFLRKYHVLVFDYYFFSPIILINNFRHLLPPPSAGRHLLLQHLLMLAVSTLSRKSVSVTGKTCVNSRRVDVVALAGRR